MIHRTTASTTLACEGCGGVLNANEPVWGVGEIVACSQECARNVGLRITITRHFAALNEIMGIIENEGLPIWKPSA